MGTSKEAKEKAWELVKKFYYPILDKAAEDHDSAHEVAKQCAIICVDEILKCHIWKYNSPKHVEFWKQVKHEIQQL